MPPEDEQLFADPNIQCDRYFDDQKRRMLIVPEWMYQEITEQRHDNDNDHYKHHCLLYISVISDH